MTTPEPLTEAQHRALHVLRSVRALNPTPMLPATLEARTLSDIALTRLVLLAGALTDPAPQPTAPAYGHGPGPVVETTTAPGDISRTFVEVPDDDDLITAGDVVDDVHTVNVAAAVIPAQFLNSTGPSGSTVVPVLMLNLITPARRETFIIAPRDDVLSPEVALADLGDRITSAIEKATTAAGRINQA